MSSAGFDTPVAPPVSEDAVSQIPALFLLRRLGWEFLAPAEAVAAREQGTRGVLLATTLKESLARINSIETREGTIPFPDEAINAAVRALSSPDDDGLVTTNERIWDLIRLGVSIPVTVDGRSRGRTVRFIDWEHPENNTWQVTEEFTVDRHGSSGEDRRRRPDLVCFVNGIPFVVIECKRHVLPGEGNAVDQAISQHLRNQRPDEIPRLYQYAQMLLALSSSNAKYGVTGTPAAHWSHWREQAFDDASLEALRTPASAEEIARIRNLLERNPHRTRIVDDAQETLRRLETPVGEATPQDRLLQSICTPSRLLELVRHYTLFEKEDGTNRKVARYQQYGCVRKCLERIDRRRADGRRDGGIVWHTQGSGKSLTMFLLAKRILQEHAEASPRVLVVTDRVDLDDQITDTFRRAGAEVSQADSSARLDTLLRSPRTQVITTTVHKFETYTKKNRDPIDDPNIFVLVDEGHRTQSGTLHASMRLALPKASMIGFTGTPILKGDKQTALAFGDMIDTYTIAEAVEDGAVVNLYYEGRHADVRIDEDPIDRWIEHHTRELDPKHVQQLKQRYSSIQSLNQTQEKIRRQAADIALHFKTNFQSGDTGLKAQLVTPTKVAAIRYKEALDALGVVSSAVLMSAPDSREGNTTVAREDRLQVQKFWDEMIKEHGSEGQYVRETIRRFKKEKDPEIIIVVDMLLTGFDAPNNACLYLTRKLRDHNLLQAIARVNRVHPAKQYGLVIDYYGVVEELDAALGIYAPKDGDFEGDDLADVLTDLRKEVAKLPDIHSSVWDLFNGVENDLDSHSASLVDPEKRRRFNRRVSEFGRCLGSALASEEFWKNTAKDRIRKYQVDLKYFLELRKATAIRYAETVDFGAFDAPIRKLLDEHVEAGAPETIVDPVTVFDDSFERDVETFATPEAKAEAIAHRLSRTIDVELGDDPAYARKLGEMLEEVWADYREKRLNGGQFFERVQKMAEETRQRRGTVKDRTKYHEVVLQAGGDALADVDAAFVEQLAADIEAAIQARTIVDWQDDPDAVNRMKAAIEDAIFDWTKAQSIKLGFDAIDRILDDCIKSARKTAR
ncbi:MAG: type I restriction endonuclease subunit R [Phycisphaera sp.]|nr:type I restriction endonuclease subunit R [Phycisphaera sp.]